MSKQTSDSTPTSRDEAEPERAISRKPVRPTQSTVDALADVPERFADLWGRFAAKVMAYFSRALLVTIGGLVAFTAAWGFGQWMEARREKATEVLGRAVRTAEADLLRDGEKEDPEADPPRYKTAKERSDAVFKVVDELASQYGSSDAAKRGSLLKAGLLYDGGKFADAEAIYRQFVDSKPADTSLVALAYEGLGLCAEARSDFAAAFAAFDRQAGETFARDRARMHQARVYIKQGNKQKAIDMYKELLAKAGASSPIRDDIQNRLAALEP